MRTKAEKKAIQAKKDSTDMHDIKERASRQKGPIPQDKCSIQHLQRTIKNQKALDRLKLFQVEHDFCSFKNEAIQEKKSVYLSKEAN